MRGCTGPCFLNSKIQCKSIYCSFIQKIFEHLLYAWYWDDYYYYFWIEYLILFICNAVTTGGSAVKESSCHAGDAEMQVWSLGWKIPWGEEMATHSRVLAWRIPWTEERGGLQSMGSQRTGHNWMTKKQQTLLQPPMLSLILIFSAFSQMNL